MQNMKLKMLIDKILWNNSYKLYLSLNMLNNSNHRKHIYHRWLNIYLKYMMHN